MNSASIYRTLAGCMSRLALGRLQTMSTVNRNVSTSCAMNKVYIIENNEQFMDKVMNSNNPVVVNFHAEWCEPCKILSPKLKESLEPSLQIDLAIVDVEKNPELVHTFEVKAVPAVIAVRNGLVVDKFIGLVDANMIENLINKLINHGKSPSDTSNPI